MAQAIKQKNILIGCTGSVASIKLPNLISELKSKDSTFIVSTYIHPEVIRLCNLMISR